jgi:PEP-CTERM motif-containing protein
MRRISRSRNGRHSLSRLRRALPLAIAGVLSTAAPILAVDRTWIGLPGGSWSNPANWNPNGIPQGVSAPADGVYFAPIGSGSYIEDVNLTSGNGLLGLFFGNGTNSTPTLTQSSTNYYDGIDDLYSGTFNQTGGIHESSLELGIGGSATYILAGGSLSSSDPGFGFEGGFGTFIQSGGSSSLGALTIGYGTASSGIASFSAGSLSAYSIYAGFNGGVGTYLQSGGSANIGAGLVLGEGTGSSGVAVLSAGSMSANYIDAGYGGVGTFIESGSLAVCNLAGNLSTIGDGTGALGTASISAGSLQAGSEAIAVGYAGGFGTFSQSGGSSNFGTLAIGVVNGPSESFGTFSLSGGSLTALSNTVGSGGAGTFLQSGSLTACSLGSLAVGAYGGVGTFLLSGGTLNAAGGYMVLGYGSGGGAGTFLQSGSLSVSSFGTIYAADAGSGSLSTGWVSLSGGSLTASVTYVASDQLRYDGLATFAQSGGSANLGQLNVAYGTGAFGTVAFSGGSLTASSTIVGTNSGLGTISQSGSLTVSSLGTLTIGPTGTLALSAGTMDVKTIKSAGLLNITGGTLAITNAGSLGTGSITSIGISGPGVLDVGSSGVVIEYGNGTSPVGDLSFAHTARNYPAGSIQRYAQTGFNNFNWNGPGIISSYAENDPNGLTAVGIVDENDLGIYPNDYTKTGGGTGTWMGQPINDTNNVLVRMTYYGDGNLDGVVNKFDVTALSQGYSGLAGYVGWSDGDYNYDGQINKNDVSLLAASYVFQGAPLGDAITPAQAQYLLALDPDMPANVQGEFDAIAAGETPEPGSVAVIGAVAIGLLGRRRKRVLNRPLR